MTKAISSADLWFISLRGRVCFSSDFDYSSSGVIAANGAAVAADKSNAQVVFRASATAHDAVARTVSGW